MRSLWMAPSVAVKKHNCSNFQLINVEFRLSVHKERDKEIKREKGKKTRKNSSNFCLNIE